MLYNEFMNSKKTHSHNIIACGNSAKIAHSIATWHFAGDIPPPGTPDRKINDALQETLRWALDYKNYHSAIAKLLAYGIIDEDDMKHPTTIAYKRNIRDKKKFVPEILNEDEWNAFRKTKPSDDRVAEGVLILLKDLHKIINNKELSV